MKEKKAGVLSPDLLAALGMPDQTNTPPPWLINMQVRKYLGSSYQTICVFICVRTCVRTLDVTGRHR